MISSRNAAIFAAIALGLLLWLRPVIGRMGAPAKEIRTPELWAEQRSSTENAPASASPALPVRHLEAASRALFDEINTERVKAGLHPLLAEPRLAELAIAHCDDMLTRNFFDHIDPDGVGPTERVARGHRRWIGRSKENIWMDTGFSADDEPRLAQQILRNWMGSRGQRENILQSEFTHLGIGVSIAGDQLRATLLLGQACGLLAEALPESLPRGSMPQLVAQPYGGEPAAEQIDLFAEGRPRSSPCPLAAAKLDVEPGSYLLRFYFPNAGGYTIAYGPEVRITP